MTTVYFDSPLSDAERRAKLYGGDIFVISPSPAATQLCSLADDLLKEAFAPHDPEFAQEHFEVEKFAQILAELKPRFIHHEKCKELIPQILQSASHGGCPFVLPVRGGTSPARLARQLHGGTAYSHSELRIA